MNYFNFILLFIEICEVKYVYFIPVCFKIFDADRDGVLKGINWPSTLELARSTTIPVIASGGLASMDDVEMMTRPEMQLLEGAISGRALYDGRIDVPAALEKLSKVAA